MKNIVLAIFYILLNQALPAQSSDKYNGFGIKAGYGAVSIANQNNYGQREMDYDVHTGVTFGIEYDRQISNKGFVLLGLNYMSGGQDYQDEFSNATFEKDVSFSVISVPLIYRHVFKKYDDEHADDKGRIFIQTGIEGAMLSGVSMNHSMNGQDIGFKDFILFGNDNPHRNLITGRSIDDLGDLYNKFGIGATAGIGFEYLSSEHTRLIVEIKGGISISDINATDWQLENRENVYQSSHNTYLTLNLGLIFGKNNSN